MIAKRMETGARALGSREGCARGARLVLVGWLTVAGLATGCNRTPAHATA